MRLIDADAFKSYLWHAYKQIWHRYPDNGAWAREVTEDFAKEIDAQPTIVEFDGGINGVVVRGEEYCKKAKWIPVSERLPDKKQNVIVTINYFETHVDVDSWDGDMFWSFGDCVKAWMPLPEPWKGEEE